MAVGLFVLLSGYAAYEWVTLPQADLLRSKNPPETALMVARAKEAQAEGRKVRKRHKWVELPAISTHLVNAVLISEDASFYLHKGVDTRELKEVASKAIEERSLGRGASTITQQLAKNLWLSTDRSLLRKLKELVLAHRLEEALSKKRILTLYLNLVEWGDGVYGVEAGAQEHFGVSAAALSPGKAVMLASMLPSPRKWTPASRSKALRTRSLRLIEKLEELGRLDASQAQAARTEVEAQLGAAEQAGPAEP